MAERLSDIGIQRELGGLPGWSRRGDSLTYARSLFARPALAGLAAGAGVPTRTTVGVVLVDVDAHAATRDTLGAVGEACARRSRARRARLTGHPAAVAVVHVGEEVRLAAVGELVAVAVGIAGDAGAAAAAGGAGAAGGASADRFSRVSRADTRE